MSIPEIALFDASVGDTPAERNVRRELDATVTAFKVSESEFPEWPGADGSWPYDGVVISGSQTSVYDRESWMETLEELLRDLHELGVPMLGICWGHQFLAQALGGCVAAMDEYELAVEPIKGIHADSVQQTSISGSEWTVVEAENGTEVLTFDVESESSSVEQGDDEVVISPAEQSYADDDVTVEISEPGSNEPRYEAQVDLAAERVVVVTD